MSRTEATRIIHAPIERVFDTVAHIQNFSKAVPAITKVEFLSEQRQGAGTRFKETRRFGKREAATELEVTEYVENDRIRIVADQGGTLWDSVFTVKPAGEGVELKLVMDANAYRLAAKVFNPLIKGMIRKHLEADMDAVKEYCEQAGA